MRTVLSAGVWCGAALLLAALVAAQRGGGGAGGDVDPKLAEVLAKLPTPGTGKVFVRTIPADVLRDYQGQCYSYNNHKFFAVNETWAISGVCAKATCLALPISEEPVQYGLFEQVLDCGPRVLDTFEKCKYTRTEDLQKSFPECCPTFECEADFNPRDLLLPSGPPDQPAE